MFRKQESIQTLAASIALGVGLLVYLLDRQPETTYFLHHWIILTNHSGLSLGSIGYHLPTFVHVYAFILLTAVVMTPGSVHAYSICATWFTVECLFECAQHASVASWIAKIVPDWFNGIPFFENTASYFLMGTFDSIDLISIGGGTVAAYLTIKLCQLKERQNETYE